jgi:hypothetical protein
LEQAVSRNRRNLHWKWLPLAAVLAALSVGCGSSDSADGTFDSAGSGGTDSGPMVNGDAGGQGGAEAPNRDGGIPGFESNPVDQLLANPERNPEDILGGVDPLGARGHADAAVACYASTDECGDAECQAFASCCVNSGTCCAPIDDPPLPAVLDFQKCAGQTADACAEGVGSDAFSFSQPEPVLSGRGLVPNGTATAEGGAVIGGVVNLSAQRVQVDVQFTLPVGCNGTCLESAGVAFTAGAPGAFVDAEVGLLLSGSRDVVSLMIGNAVADTFDAGTDSTTWRLVLSPNGSAQVFRNESSLGTHSFDAAALAQARFVLFGRNLGAATTSAAIAVIEVESSFCDNPTSWNERQAATITLNGNAVPDHAFGSGPSIVDQGTATRMAYEVDGEIFVSEKDEAAPEEFFLSDGTPALVPTEPYEALGVGDPELVWDGSSLFLFYTARDSEGAGSIGAAVSVQDPPAFMKGNGPTLVPMGDVVSYDAPSVVYRDGLWLLVVRATLSDGATELHAFYSDLGTDWVRVIDGGLEKLTRVESATAEITDPSLIIHNSAYHLYYARRTGTRWSVELAVSDELILWRSMGEVLGGSNEGFDSLGARSPDALSQPDRIDIVYAGQDGVSFRLGTASRAAPSDTAPSFF